MNGIMDLLVLVALIAAGFSIVIISLKMVCSAGCFLMRSYNPRPKVGRKTRVMSLR